MEPFLQLPGGNNLRWRSLMGTVQDKKVSETEAMENSPDPSVDAVVTHPWTRYVAMGDSFTEGIGDPEPASPGGHRGWADRVAEELSRGHNDFAYANLAVRGRLLQ